MDPNAVLADIRKRIATLETEPHWCMDGEAHALAEDFAALDQWLSNGGFTPDAWKGDDPDANERGWLKARGLY
jgi:hypothetical protein